MASGIIEFEPSEYLQGKIEWSSTGDITNNTSLVTCSLFARRTNSYTTTGKSWSGNVNIGGFNHTFSSMPVSTAVGPSWVRMQTFNDYITHELDGTKSITISGSIKGPSGTALANNTSSGSGQAVLDRLHKSPEITITGMTELNNNLTGVSNDTFVQYLSKKQIAFTPTLYDDATVNGVTVSNGDTNVTGTSSPLVLDFTNKILYTTANILPIKAIISDSMNSTGETTINYSNYILYQKPAIIPTMTTTKRNGQTSGKVLLNLSGTFFNQTIGNVANTITVKYHFWEKGTTEPTTWIIIPSSNVTINNNDISVYNYEIGNDDETASNYFDFEKAYDIKIQIEDAFYTDETTKGVTVGEPVWSERKDRVDFKKITVKGTEIIERETASDGSYNVIKFADGTMIINQRVYVASYSGNYGLSSYIPDYPESFVEAPFVIYSWYERSADVNHIIFRGAPSTTNPNGANNPSGGGANEVYTAFLGSATSSTGTIIYITSTGRWK